MRHVQPELLQATHARAQRLVVEPYDPDSWLSEYDEETKNNGIALINRMRRENTEEFYNELVTGVLSEDCGLSTHAQADILRDFDRYALCTAPKHKEGMGEVLGEVSGVGIRQRYPHRY